jgi:serine/threonine protein kinase
VGSQAAEQIIAGVVLSERLAVTMYGAIHRASLGAQRNLRGLIVDPKLLADDSFRIALTGAAGVAAAVALEHPHIVPTVAVESGGEEVVVVTRGVGRYVTVQDLIESAKSHGKKVPVEVAGAIGKVVVGALAAAHKAGVVHGAVHPRSVLVDESGEVRLGDFVVGKALTSAVAQGADSSLWRGLSGYIAPELVVGEDPTPAADVFAVGALLFTMLAGETPPGSLRATPAVERLVQRALDTDVTRRYKAAPELLENLLEAFEDDRWELAERGELIKAAGLSQSDENIDDATEDLLASLGSASTEVQTPIRPSVDFRAEAAAARQQKSSPGMPAGKRLDALLEGLSEETTEDPTGFTAIDAKPFSAMTKDPISELIRKDPRKNEAIVSSAAQDEAAALGALAGLDEPVRRASSVVEAANAAAARLEAAADRAEAAAARVRRTSEPIIATEPADAEPEPEPPPARTRTKSTPMPVAAPAPKPVTAKRPAAAPPIDPIADVEPPNVNLRGPGHYIIGFLAVAAVGGAGYGIYHVMQNQQASIAEQKALDDKKQKEADERTKLLTAALADPGTIEVHSTPNEAGVWLRLGATPLTTDIRVASETTHEIGLVLPGHDETEIQVVGADWSGDKETTERTASVKATLPDHDAKKKPPARTALPLQPDAEHKPTTLTGSGPLHVESTPAGAEAWLFIGTTDTVRFSDLTAGRAYELEVVKDGFVPAHISIAADDWRDGDAKTPIDQAKKKSTLTRSVDLVPDKPGKK